MVMATLQKYPAEVRTYVFDFSQMDEIVAGDTISSITSVTASPSGLTVGTSQISGSDINVVLSSGTSGTTYTVSCIIVTSSNATLEGQGQLQVL